MILNKYNELNELYNYEPISDREWIPVSRKTSTNWANLYAVDLSGCNLRNRRKNNRSGGTCNITEELSDINRWNSGYWAAVLVSPRIAVACAHYWRVVPGQQNNLKFMGRSGKVYSPKCINATEIGDDRVVLEFEEDLPEDDLKIYKIVDARYIPKGTKLWFVENQGRIHFRIWNALKEWRPNRPMPFPYSAMMDYDPVAGDVCAIFSGDSGTPVLITDPHTNETYLQSMFAGGGHFYDEEDTSLKLKEFDNRIQFVRLSEKRGDFNRDGLVNSADMGQLMSDFGKIGKMAFRGFETDINNDGEIDAADLGELLGMWGPVKPNILAYEDWYEGGGWTGPIGGTTDIKGPTDSNINVTVR